ncbi:MAG: hypothetical protein M1504_00605 [Candidatus Marsarchaeota archaeon]|nr:hypothetical protein [Candidatus Marsarchaeota archaeon]
MLGKTTKTFRAQSAMEYLMTYGWAILIIAVVLGALFSLGVFSGGSLLGTSCVASPGFLCSSPVLGTSGTLAFTFGENQGYSIYDVQMACAATSNAGGLPSNAAAWMYINGNGIATAISSAPSNSYGNAINLVSGQTVSVTALSCYGSTGTQLATASSAAAIGQSFSGFLWLNYTASNSAPGGTNAWVTQKVATVTVKVT